MKNLRNSVSLIGRIGQEPEITQFEKGTKKAVLSLATDESYKNKEGEKVENTQWHRLIVWGPQVTMVEKFIKKGMEICIEGRINYNQWDDKDGKRHYTTEILVNDILLLGSANK
jgi:single-strand DNA-binding protein